MRTASTAERSLLASSSLLAQHHGDHGRHRGQEGRRDACAAASTYPLVVNCGSSTMVSPWLQRRLAHRQAVHVIERRRHQRALARRHRPAHPLADRPEMRIVRQHHALRPAGRARRVEEHRRFLGLHLERRERPLVEERREIRSRRRSWARCRAPAPAARRRRSPAWRRSPRRRRPRSRPAACSSPAPRPCRPAWCRGR